MNVIILAAGQGTRLRPFTNDRPKCMVELKGKALLHHQLETLEHCGIKKENIALVGGYLQDALVAPGIQQFRNENYMQTNMAATLFAAEAFMSTEQDLIIAYGDIVYQPQVLESLIKTKADVVIAADLDWYQLWQLRMENPLDDAETFKMTDSGQILELGKKPENIADVQAQYIGLIKIAAHKVKDLIQHYKNMDKNATYDGKDYNNLYMTSLIQNLIDNNWHVQAALIHNGWLEVDSVKDLKAYENLDDIYDHSFRS